MQLATQRLECRRYVYECASIAVAPHEAIDAMPPSRSQLSDPLVPQHLVHPKQGVRSHQRESNSCTPEYHVITEHRKAYRRLAEQDAH